MKINDNNSTNKGCRRAITAIAPLLLGAVLAAGCDEGWEVDESWAVDEIDREDTEFRGDEEEKTETHNPPAPPTPPGSEAEEKEDLVKKGKPKKDKNVGPNDVKGRYIVLMKKGKKPEQAANAVGAVPDHVFSHVIPGFAGPLTQGQLKALEKRPDVEMIEPDQIVTTATTQLMDGAGQPIGLDRIDQSSRPLNGKYIYFRDAWGVRVYVIDTGIQSNHPDFYNALAMFDAFGGNGQDCNGHGTHVARTIGGTVHGVAKRAFLRGVRVLGCNGSGTWSQVIAGMDWVAKNHIKPAVANMSLSGGYSSIVNTAVNNLAASGVFVAVAAGNSNANACNYSPASAVNVFSVAASSAADARASFSNFADPFTGRCVHAYAPGVNIKSTWISSGTRILQGTSMASPHVAATAALYKAIYGDASYSTIRNNLLLWASRDKITGNPSGTPNVLLYQPF